MEQTKAAVQLVISFRKCLLKGLDMSLPSKMEPILQHHFEMAYAVGFDVGRRQTAHGRGVVLMKDNVIVNTFPTITKMAGALDVHKSTISKALRTGHKVKGYDVVLAGNENS